MAEDFYVSVGDTVLLRDRSSAVITDLADPGEPEGEYQTIDRTAFVERGVEVVTSSIPAETIFVGYDKNTGAVVVSDLSEIVSVLN